MTVTIRTAIAATAALALAVGAVAATASALSKQDRISHAGLGPIKLGMTERQIERAAKRPITLGAYPAGADCAIAMLAGKTQGLFTGSGCGASTSAPRALPRRRAFASAAPSSASSPPTPAPSRASRRSTSPNRTTSSCARAIAR